jgi:uncharacterized repeat protein (TIGR01451 family)
MGAGVWVRRVLVAVVASLGLAALTGAAPALAAAPWWHLETRVAPTVVSPAEGSQVELHVAASNIGDASTSGSVTITDTVPKGLRAYAVSAKAPMFEANGVVGPFECTKLESPAKQYTEKVTCTYGRQVDPYEPIVIEIKATVEAGVSEASGLAHNKVEIEGGGPAKSEAEAAVPVSSSGVPFGIEKFTLQPENEGGSPDTQAGSHPYQLTTQFNLAETLETSPTHGIVPATPSSLKDLTTKLPAGLVGTANEKYVARCSSLDFSTFSKGINRCPDNTAIGVAVVTVEEPAQIGLLTRVVPLFNLEPQPDEPARFGFEVLETPVVLDAHVRSGEDYSVNVSVENASALVDVIASTVSFWGVPGDPTHTQSRGWKCLTRGRNFLRGEEPLCTTPPPEPEKTPKAFLTLPTACNVGFGASVVADSWAEPGARLPGGAPDESDSRWKKASTPELPPLTGCESLPFSPSLTVTPETGAANTPSGLTVNVHVPQTSTIEPGGLAEAAVKQSTVTLPPGVLLSPSAAEGLETCSEGLVGFTGEHDFEPNTPMLTFTPRLPEHQEPGINFCPSASKVGEVHIKTPDLSEELVGGVYLAQQNANPFGSLFAMYIVASTPITAEHPIPSVVAKLSGEVRPDPNSGQITTVFNNTPQVPFEDLTLRLFGGPRASVTTPPTCGTYTTTSTFVPWSTTEAHPVAEHPSAAFGITSGPNGTGCANPLPLGPSFNAGSSNLQAGGFTSFAVNLGHGDGEQAPTALNVHLPAGMAAMISSVTLCKDAQAAAGTCGPESLIGHATATAGLGSTPFTETGGLVYITEKPKTGKYTNASFGLSVVIPTKAGPFDFGNVVTRSGLYVDPNTTAVTVASELPTMVNTVNNATGVPVQLKQIHVVVDRPNFQFNPTNCTPTKVGAEIVGAQGAVAQESSPLQVANCPTLPFHPELTAELTSQFDKQNGLAMKITVKSAPGQANIQKTKVVFPMQIPSRLTTLQKACTDAVFKQNPALCPEGSHIGTAIAHTPVLKSPLVGPAILVSHGGAAFPDAVFLLQGEGVEVILDGETNIHNGVTSSTFNSVPDAPVTTFEVELPRGPHSAFTGFGNLCAPTTAVTVKKRVTVRSHGKVKHVLRTVTENRPQPLVMPTTLGGQNGHTIEKITPIKVTGCSGVKGSKAKKKPHKKKHKHASKSKKH